MFRLTLRSLRARRRRLAATGLAVVLGVGFLAATLVLGDTFRAGFGAIYREADAGTDVVVRNATVMGGDGDRTRGPLSAGVLDPVRRVPGVAVAVGQVEGPAQVVGSDGTGIGGQGPPTTGAGWVADRTLNPYRVVRGRAPARPGEVVIDEATAEAGHLRVGSRTTVRTPAPTRVRVVGLVRFGRDGELAGATYVAFTPTQAAELLGQPGSYSSIVVRGDGSVGETALRDRIRSVLPAGTEAITAAEHTAEQQDQIEGDVLGFVSVFLLVFAGVALVVATFSIHNTFTILLAQRNRESALLRALGASRRQVLASIALEAVVVGTAASTVGLGVGLVLARLLDALLTALGLDLPTAGLGVHGRVLAISMAAGLLTTLVAALGPAIRATRVPPIEALRSSAVEAATTARSRLVAGLVLAAGGVALVVTAPSAAQPLGRAGIGSLLVIVAAVVLGPAYAKPVAAAIGAPIAVLRGQPGRLARRNAIRNPRRTSASALALLIGTAVVALFATFGSSIRASFDQTIQQSFGGDLVLTQDGFSGAGLDRGLAPAIGRHREVAASVGFANAVARVDGRTIHATATDPRAMTRLLDLDVRQGDLAGLRPGQIAISTGEAEAQHLRLGSPMRLRYPDGRSATLRVGAVYAENHLFGDWIVDRADWAPHEGRSADVAVLVKLRPGVDVATGRAIAEREAKRHGGAAVRDRDEFIAQQLTAVDKLLTLAYGMLVLAVVIALMGIANTLALSIHERTRELGLLRAVGLRRSQLRSAVRWESVITAVVGTAAGLGLGSFLGWGLVRAMAAQEGGIVFRPAGVTLAVVGVLAVVAGLLAAVRPARRAARLDVLDAIATA